MRKTYPRMYISDCICPVCESITPIARSKHRPRQPGHRKNMYCYSCKTERNFIEMSSYWRRDKAFIDRGEEEWILK